MPTILLVEDDPALASHWRQALEAEDFRVIHEPSVERAIDVLEGTPVDLVITDIVLEISDSQLSDSGGFAVISYIALNLDPQPKIIATSGQASNSNFVDRNFKKMDSMRALRKPVTAEKLVAIVHELLRQPETKTPNIAIDDEQIQQLIHSNEAMLELLGTTDGVWDWKVGTDEVTYAPGFRKLVGFDRDDVRGFPDTLETLADRIHPDDQESMWAEVNKSLLDQTPFFHEFRLKHKDSHYIWVRSRATASFDDQGNALRMVGSTHDITDEKRNLRELHRLNAAVQNATVAVIGVTEDARIVYTNDIACRARGYTRAEMESMTIPEIDADVPSIEFFQNEVWPKVASREKAILHHKTHRRKDGSLFPVEITSMLVEYEHDEPFVMSFVRDITEEQALKQAALETNERFDWAMTNANIGIWDWEVKTDTVAFSDTWKTQLGYLPDADMTSFADWEELLHADDKEAALQRVKKLTDDPHSRYESTFRLRTFSGDYRWILAVGRGVFDNRGALKRFIGVHVDIHDLEVAKQNAQESVAQFLDNSRDAVYRVAEDGTFVYANKAATEMLGHSREQLLQMRVCDIDPDYPPDVWNSWWQKMRQERQAKKGVRPEWHCRTLTCFRCIVYGVRP